MRRLYISLVLCLFVGVASLTTGCSKLSKLAKKPKVVAVAVIAGITASFGYLGRAVGIQRNKRKKREAAAAAKGVSSFKLEK